MAWDMAAGMILVREAGGFVTDHDDRDDLFEKRNVIAGNSSIHGDHSRACRADRGLADAALHPYP